MSTYLKKQNKTKSWHYICTYSCNYLKKNKKQKTHGFCGSLSFSFSRCGLITKHFLPISHFPRLQFTS